MKRVLVLANNLSQASFRVRIAALAPLLAERGFLLDVQLRPKGWLRGPRLWRLLTSAKRAHAVILQRRLLNPWEATRLRRHARKIFYDIDDALMYHNRPVGLVSRWRTARRFRATARALDHVVAGNDYLADIFRREGKSATIIPTMVDSARYARKLHAATDSPRLVWIGSNSTLDYVEKFLPALEQAARDVKGLRLVTIGDKTVSSSALNIDHEIWSEQTEAAALLRGDIGIAPTPADQWTLGKCGFKILQYMAAGLPVIASPVGANEQIVQEGITGFLPATPGEWPAAIARLAADAALRARMGDAGRELAEQRYSLAVAADEWARLLNEA
ncbi:MAG TPA: glycosyltransferase family 4 protein [Tepidisphaeraceae bacterium]|jgi:glycosyltransferase involved in cell wall biosynthesis|nr:glycosyltransferase family 4 protein [Tepidisphaeraceae bacterium]